MACRVNFDFYKIAWGLLAEFQATGPKLGKNGMPSVPEKKSMEPGAEMVSQPPMSLLAQNQWFGIHDLKKQGRPVQSPVGRRWYASKTSWWARCPRSAKPFLGIEPFFEDLTIEDWANKKLAWSHKSMVISVLKLRWAGIRRQIRNWEWTPTEIGSLRN